jgi:hypothetical protein
MTQKTLSKLKNDLHKMTRIELVDKIWEFSSDEIESTQDLLIIAKENDNQLKERLYHILSWYEYLAK